jgi:hypothetical protein
MRVPRLSAAAAKLPWQGRPPVATAIELPRFVVVRVSERSIAAAQSFCSTIGRCDVPVRPIDQCLFHLPHVSRRQSPVVGTQHAKIDYAVRRDAARQIDVAVEVAERQRARRGEDRSTTVESRVAGTRDRSPPAWASMDKDHVIKQIDRLETQHERRVAVLLKDDRCGQHGFQAVCRSSAYDSPEAS